MPRIVSKMDFSHPQWKSFLEKIRKEIPTQRFFNQMRWYTGATNVNFSAGHAAEEFQLKEWMTPIHKVITDAIGDPDWTFIRELTYCACGPGSRGVPFKASNYLDPITRRYHYVISGIGVFKAAHAEVAYSPGDLLEFSSEDYGKEWTNQFQQSTEQLVICLGHRDQKHINSWDLFDQHYQKGRK